MATERLRNKLRSACLAGAEPREVAALLHPGRAVSAAPHLAGWCFRQPSAAAALQPKELLNTVLCPPFPADGGNTLLHYLLGGAGLGTLGRLLWASAGGVASAEPGRHDVARARLVAWLLSEHPCVLRLLCACNAAGLTPLHCCVWSCSAETLRVLVAVLRPLPPADRRLLLSAPTPQGLTPLALALASRQWEVAALLVQAGGHLLAQDFLAAALRVARLLGGAAASPAGDAALGRLGSKGAGGAEGGRGGPVAQAVTEAVRWGLGRVLDLMAGQQAQQERAAVEQHLQARQQQQQQQAKADIGGEQQAAAGGSGASSARQATSRAEVLQGTADIDRLRQEQIEGTAVVLGVSTAEAAALLAKHGWSERAAVQARLTPAGSSSGDGAPPEERGCGGGGSSSRASRRHGGVSTAAAQASASSSLGLAAVLDLAAQEGEQPQQQQEGSAATPSPDTGGGMAGARVCLVCFEECAGDEDWQGLPCGHPTCTACWRGILQAQLDTGEVHRVVCPQLGCGLPLPMEAAQALLPARQYGRYKELVAQRYVASNPSLRWCPRPGCGKVVRLAGAAGDGAAAGCSLGVRCACGHSFCWACSGDAHEPASCEQTRRWEAELAALREAAPSQDQQWLASNTKRCPACSVPIEKNGGCLHMTCRVCGHEWCWNCGRSWREHRPETGGYYHCILTRRSDLADFQQPSASAAAPGLGALGWLRDVWGALQAASAQRALEGWLRQFLSHDFNPARLSTLAAHIERLLEGVGAAGSSALEGAGGGAGCRGQVEGGEAELGPATLLGLSLSEAAGLRSEEWAQLVAAAAASLAESGRLGGGRAGLEAPASGPAAATGPGAAAEGGKPARAAAGNGIGAPSSSSAGNGSSSSSLDSDLNLPRLTDAVAAAHSVLQHAAVVGWALGASSYGPRRRFLARLSQAIEEQLGRLEGLLLSMPEAEAAVQCQQRHFAQEPGSWAGGSGLVASLFGRLLRSMYGVTPPHLRGTAGGGGKPVVGPAGGSPAAGETPQPPAAGSMQQQQQQLLQQRRVQERLARGLSAEQLRQQVLYALALRQQGRRLQAEVAALEGAVSELLEAGQAGLFAG